MTQQASQQPDTRWKDYVLLRGQDLAPFWRDHCQEPKRRLLFVAGRGFDPRTTLGLEQIATLAGKCVLDLLALVFDEGESHPPQVLVDAAAINWSKLQSYIANGTVNSKPVRFRSDDGRRIAARSAANVISRAEEIAGYTDVVVDVSAMPRGVYFPLISRLIFFHDELRKAAQPRPNIHVLVSEDPILDSQIREHGIDETASFLHPFEGEFNREATGVSPRVWIPVLGEGRTTQFDRIYDLVKPDEVCPVLPSPSRNPRRGDDIVMEYRDLLFDQLRVDPRNFIYASEFNAFEVYRQIRRTALHYHEVLGLIGGCKVAFSPLCSKLMSLGVLLVAYELKTTGLLNAGIAHIECQGYEMPESARPEIEQVGLWLAGECYG
jgi:hypothetical protein